MSKKNNELDLPIVRVDNRSGKGFLIFVNIVLFICCIGLVVFIVYNKYFIIEDNTPVIKKTSEALEQVQIDGTGLLDVEDTINSFEYAYNNPFSNYFGYIYSNKLLKSSDFDEGAALFACLYPYLDESVNVSYVANNTVKAKYKSIFGPEKVYNPNNVNAGGGYDIKYDPINKYYAYQRLGVGGYFYPTFVTFNESSSISEEKIIIVKRVAYLEYNPEHTMINVYVDKTKSKAVGVISVTEGAFNPSEIKAKYKSSLSQYKFIFVKSKDTFVFDKIERTR